MPSLRLGVLLAFTATLMFGGDPPRITTNPKSGEFYLGQGIYLYVVAEGTAPLKYQWSKDGTPVAKATTSSFRVSSSTVQDCGSYTVTVNDENGSTTSEPAIVSLTKERAPYFYLQPASGSLRSGEGIGLRIGADSSENITYSWTRNGEVIEGQREWLTVSEPGIYQATATNRLGSVRSEPAEVTAWPLDSVPAVPTFTLSPTSGADAYGAPINLRVEVAGVPTPTLQWLKDGVALPGATSNNYTKYGAKPEDAGLYTVVASNASGTTTSQGATREVAAPLAPLILRHPPSMSLLAGQSDSLNVQVRSATDITYQWYKDDVPIDGATSYSLDVRGGSGIAGRYHVVVSNQVGSITSEDAVVSLDSAESQPSLRRQSGSISTSLHDSAFFNILRAPDATVIWKKDGEILPGETDVRLDISVVELAHAGIYTAEVTSSVGTVTSRPISLTLISTEEAPKFTDEPASGRSGKGYSRVLQCAVSGTPPFAFEWKKDGVTIPPEDYPYWVTNGWTDSQLTIANMTSEKAGGYTVTVANAYGSVTSTPAQLTVAPAIAPDFIIHPASYVFRDPAHSTTLRATVAGTPPLTVQWYLDGQAIPTGSSTVEFPSANPLFMPVDETGTYTVTVSNEAGTITSKPATITLADLSYPPVIQLQPQDITADDGDSVTLSVEAAGHDPLTYQWRHNGIDIADATATSYTLSANAATAGTYTVVVEDAIGFSASLPALLTVVAGPPPVIFTDLADRLASIGSSLTFQISVTGSSTSTFEWFHDGQSIGTSTNGSFSLNNIQESDSGSYHVVVTNSAGSVTSRTATLTISSVPTNASFSGEFDGSGQWVLYLDAEGVGTLLLTLPGRDQIIYREGITVAADGSFQFGSDATTAADGANALAAFYFTGAVTGSISPTTAAITVPSLGINTKGSVANGGSTAAYAGAFDVVPLGGGDAAIHMLTTATGRLLAVAVEPSGVSIGSGTVDSSGNVNLSSGTFTASGQLGSTGFSGTVQTPENGSSPAGTPAALGGIERLANLSTRVQISSGASMTVGFVLDGSVAKQVLVRAVGPGLSKYGVPGVMTNPQLKVYRSETVQAENDDWFSSTNATQLATTAASVGAFTLGDDSLDAALLTQLNPGPYTVQVQDTNGGGGISLIEIYDANPTSSTTPRMSNLSARGPVGTGADVLVAGFVVHGNAPKRFLVRGIGATLASFGVPNTLADPQLTLFRNGGEVIATNQDWETGNSVTTLTAVSATVGAFPLQTGTTDAAILVYLAPGAYTAQVSGTGETIGEALVEVYEVP